MKKYAASIFMPIYIGFVSCWVGLITENAPMGLMLAIWGLLAMWARDWSVVQFMKED